MFSSFLQNCSEVPPIHPSFGFWNNFAGTDWLQIMAGDKTGAVQLSGVSVEKVSEKADNQEVEIFSKANTDEIIC